VQRVCPWSRRSRVLRSFTIFIAGHHIFILQCNLPSTRTES
jgi:hypothetical protein